VGNCEIRKKMDDVWEHNWTDAPDQDLILSAGYFTVTDDIFSLKTKSGGEIRTALLSKIIVFDDTGAGTPEPFTTGLAFSTRLKTLDYPYFLIPPAPVLSTTSISDSSTVLCAPPVLENNLNVVEIVVNHPADIIKSAPGLSVNRCFHIFSIFSLII